MVESNVVIGGGGGVIGSLFATIGGLSAVAAIGLFLLGVVVTLVVIKLRNNNKE